VLLGLLGLDDVLHLLSLSLGGNVATQSLLAELQGTLVLGNSEQLNTSSLVGSVADDLSNDIVNESGLLGFHALVSALSALVSTELGDLVALVWSDYHSADSHVDGIFW